MRVTTKLAWTTSLLIVVLMGVLWFALHQIRRLTDLQRGLLRVELETTVITLEQERLMPQLESLTLKIFVIPDSGYAEKAEELGRSFQGWLEELQALDLSERVRFEANELARLWTDFPLEAQIEQVLEGNLGPEDEKLLQGAFRDQMLAVREQLDHVNEATRLAIDTKTETTLAAIQREETRLGFFVAAALVAAVLILLITLRSIREPLASLEEGTRGVARGVYSYEIETSGSDEFSKLAMSFNEMVARLGELDQMKRDFLSHVSHELKTPLVAMDETNRLLLEELPGPLNQKQRKFLELNLESGRRLGDMISKLLDLARLEERAVLFELQTHDLVELSSNVADSFLARAVELGVTIEVHAEEAPVLAECDGDRIVQLVGNLVDNALKHSPTRSTVAIRVPSRSATGQARIEVADAGPGVPDDEKERIFEKFHQVGRPMTGGVGLGLAICREIVEAHHGQIWVEDNEGGGSLFVVTLLAAAEDRKAQAG